MTKRSPLEVAQEILETRYPKAQVAFVAGAFNRGEATAFSDIDLVIVFDHVDFAFRESFHYGGWPIEAFIHDPETLNYFFLEIDRKDGVPFLPNMVLEGRGIPEAHPWISKLKSLADRILEMGPPQWSDETLQNRRYAITDLIDDLRDPRNPIEALATIGQLHESLGDFYFRSRGLWSANRKHIPRRLLRVDPMLGERWVKAFEKCTTHDYTDLIQLAEEILNPYGGFLFSDYRRDAPREWRRELQNINIGNAD